MCETGFVFSSKSLLSFRREMAQPRLSMATRGLDSQIGRRWGGGGKMKGIHILIIALSEHHVDYMNRKGGHSVIMQGGSFHRCVHQIAWTR